MQTPLPSRHLLLGEGCAIAVWAESPKADVAPSARAGLFRGAVARRSGLPSAARMLATSSRPPAAPFAVQTRPPRAPLSRGIPGQPRPDGQPLQSLRSLNSLQSLRARPLAGLSTGVVVAWRLIVHLRWNVLDATPTPALGFVFMFCWGAKASEQKSR